MKKLSLFILLILLSNSIKSINNICDNVTFKTIEKCDVDWAIIGAGPAGLSIVGTLIDLGVIPDRIAWVDPEFNVGRLSAYSSVIANTKNIVFVNFLKACKVFCQCSPTAIDKLTELNLDKECPLSVITEPLKEITDCLCTKVKAIKGHMNSLYFEDSSWHVEANNQKISAYNVILATGSHPKTLDYQEFKSKEIPLDTALNPNVLKQLLKPEDIVAVVGDSHSAILILKYLTEIPVKKIVNFYKNQLEYAVDIGSIVLNINGLKGTTAAWAKNTLEKNPPANLVRVESKPEYLKKVLPVCTKIIYAVGFEKNDLPSIKENPKLDYNSTGIIAPRLFGIGIAFPEKYTEPSGKIEYNIGLRNFMEYAQRVVPCWMQKRCVSLPSINHLELLKSFEELFTIEIL